MRAIHFTLDVTKLLEVRFGESSFKPIDEYWTDFKPDNGEKTTTFIPNIVKDTPTNREIVVALELNYAEQKAANDAFEKRMYELRNQFEK
jgi:hypothetical protein